MKSIWLDIKRKIILIKDEIVVFPVPCPPARPIIIVFFLFTLFANQKHVGIKKDLIILSFFLNFSVLVSWLDINLLQSFFTFV